MENVRINGKRVSDENESGEQAWRKGKGGKKMFGRRKGGAR